MKKFIVLLVGVIFVALITASVQFAYADHTEPGIGIFKDATNVNIIDSERSSIPLENVEISKYKIFMHAVIRNVDGHLITTIENTANGAYIPHKITDHVFDTLMGKKEIVTIDNTKYERVNYIEINDVDTYTGFFNSVSSNMHSLWKLEFCLKTNEHGNKQGISCIPVFQTTTSHVPLGEGDVFRQTWTILREL